LNSFLVDLAASATFLEDVDRRSARRQMMMPRRLPWSAGKRPANSLSESALGDQAPLRLVFGLVDLAAGEALV